MPIPAVPFSREKTARLQVTLPPAVPILINPLAADVAGVSANSKPPLRIQFDVTRDMSPQAGRGSVIVHNLNQAKRDLIASTITKKSLSSIPASEISRKFIDGIPIPHPSIVELAIGQSYISLEAGYEGVAGTILEGAGARVSSVRKGPNWETKFEIVDGQSALEKATIMSVHELPVPVLDIIIELQKTMGVGVGNIITGTPFLAGAVFPNGIALEGKCRDWMDNLARMFNFQWWVDAGDMMIAKYDWATETPFPLVGAQTIPVPFIYDTPQRLWDGRVVFRAPIDPSIRPGTLVQVGSLRAPGAYIAEAVQFRGDNRGPLFDMVLTCLAPLPI
mgnify:CR=1 FL=1